MTVKQVKTLEVAAENMIVIDLRTQLDDDVRKFNSLFTVEIPPASLNKLGQKLVAWAKNPQSYLEFSW